MAADSADRVVIFDTTLRDGEQAPGCSMTLEEKILVARQLEHLGVDVIEAGFPIASPGDFESVRQIAQTVTRPIVAGLARCVPKDIERAGQAVADAKRGRIHVFLATSKIHRKYKLAKSRAEIIRLTREGVTQACGFTDDVEFSPEDASRTEPEFLHEVVEAAIDAGATTINVPDTVGYAVPEQYAELVERLLAEVSNIDKAIISVHCHDDLGMAVANSLAAVRAGARQVECTINGIGERAGSCSLEEVAMVLKTRADYYGVETGIDTSQIMKTSRLVSTVTGVHMPPNKAIVGQNAFAHESGIHQDGMLKNKSTYEIMRPEDVGRDNERLVLGKHSGRHAFRIRLEELGFALTDEHLNHAFDEFKRLADKKKVIYDEDIEALIRDEIEEAPCVYELVGFHTTSGVVVTPTATLALRFGDEEVRTDAAIGDGPVDAICKAIDRITGMTCELRDFNLLAVSPGKDALGEVHVQVACGNDVQTGRAARTDILEASARAYLAAVNRLAARVNGPRSTPSNK
jgi:2-isopropylmalate synthase